MNQPTDTTTRTPSHGECLSAAIPARHVAVVATPRGGLAGIATHAPPAYA